MQFFTQTIDCNPKPMLLQFVLRRVDAKQDNARNCAALAEYQIAEVLVFRQKQPAFRVSTRYQLSVNNRGCNLGGVNNVVAYGTQMQHQSRIDAFIGQPAHG